VLATEGPDGIESDRDEAEAERCPQEESLRTVLKNLGIAEAKLQGDLRNFPGVSWGSGNGDSCAVGWIDFPGRDLGGALHPEISKLTELRRLDLDDTNVTGSLDVLANHTQLRRLSLRHTRVTGRLEDLPKAKHLQILDLSGTKVTGDVAALANATELGFLGLSNTAVFGELESLAKLEWLEELDLSETSVSGELKSLENLNDLRELDLANLKVVGNASVMAEWPKIERIDLSGTQVEFDLFQQFEPYKMWDSEWQCPLPPALRFLDVSSTPQFSQAKDLLRPFAGCGKLATLKAAGCGLSGPLWPEIRNVFDDIRPIDEWPLSQALSVLDFARNNVTVVAKLPGSCRTLVLTGNPHVSFGAGVMEKAIKEMVFIDVRNATFGNLSEATDLLDAGVVKANDIARTVFNQTHGFACYDLMSTSLQVSPDYFAADRLCDCSPGWKGSGVMSWMRRAGCLCGR